MEKTIPCPECLNGFNYLLGEQPQQCPNCRGSGELPVREFAVGQVYIYEVYQGRGYSVPYRLEKEERL